MKKERTNQLRRCGVDGKYFPCLFFSTKTNFRQLDKQIVKYTECYLIQVNQIIEMKPLLPSRSNGMTGCTHREGIRLVVRILHRIGTLSAAHMRSVICCEIRALVTVVCVVRFMNGLRIYNYRCVWVTISSLISLIGRCVCLFELLVYLAGDQLFTLHHVFFRAYR